MAEKFTGRTVPLKEKNSFSQGKIGSETLTKDGPAVGRTKGNPIKGGGITEPTKGTLK